MNILYSNYSILNDSILAKLNVTNGNFLGISCSNLENSTQDNHNAINLKRTKNMFTKEEDQRLTKIVNEYGDKDWTLVASFMNGRSRRQCRERWKKYLCPSLNHSPWSQIEDELLISKYNQFGPKWTLIAKSFKHRTDINIKTRCIILLRRKKRDSIESDILRANFNKSNNNSFDKNISLSKCSINNVKDISYFGQLCKNDSDQFNANNDVSDNNTIFSLNNSQKNVVSEFDLDDFNLQVDNAWDESVQENSLFGIDPFFYI